MRTYFKGTFIILVGDFNAKIGRKTIVINLAGKRTIHKKTDNNGKILCNLATSTDMIIISNKFKHKREHITTCLLPGTKLTMC